MLVGHYGVAFAAKRAAPSIPLWVLFLAVQLLDVVWAPLILLGIERVRIVPGITASNPLDLYYMPYTHSLVAALLWSIAALALYRRLTPGRSSRAALVISAAVFSHWVLDFVVHRPDLPLYDNSAKVGMGLWNLPAARVPRSACSVSSCSGFRPTFSSDLRRRPVTQPPPRRFAAYLVFAGVIGWLEVGQHQAYSGLHQ